VTDNQFLGFARPYESFRESFDLFERRGGQIGGKSGGVPRDEVMHWVHPTTRDGKTIERVTRYMANSSYAHDEGRSFAASVFTSGVGALRAAAAGRKPFALVVDTFEPHEPWTPPRRYIDMYGDPDHRGAEPGMPRYSRVENWLDERQAAEVLPRMRALYAAEVTMTDRWLGVLLDELHAQQLERDTVVVLVGDHGFLLGEHGWTGKISVSLHPELTNVPLIVVDPRRRRAGERSAYRASTHDIGRTVLRLCGVKPPEEMEGADLSRILRGGEPPARDYSYGGYANCHFLRDDRWTYFSDNLMNRPHLFDVRSDPDEAEDVAAKHPDVVRRLHRTVVERAGGRLPYYPE
jgi:arylsulfatase A-like enzyme